MLTYYLLPLSPALMRFYRTRILLDQPTLLRFLPEEGRLLDVGCGTGLLNYVIAKRRPRLQILGVDIDRRAIELASRYNRADNLDFAPLPLGEVTGCFDCISFVDVMHHTTEDEARGLLEQAAPLLAGDGQVIIKDVGRKGGWASYAHDRYITRSKVVRLAELEEMLRIVPDDYRVVRQLKKYRFPFPHYYVTLGQAPQPTSRRKKRAEVTTAPGDERDTHSSCSGELRK